MDLIKLSTKFYPYTIAELQADYPNVSFPLGLVGVDLGDFDAAEVITDEQPKYDPELEAIEPLPPKKIKKQWVVRWHKRRLTKEEIKVRKPADWTGFREALLADEEFNIYYGMGLKEIPALTSNLLADLGPINDVFSARFEKFCQAVEVNADRRLEWAELADSFNLPVDFVNLIRGEV